MGKPDGNSIHAVCDRGIDMKFEELMARMLANRAEIQERIAEDSRTEVKEEFKEKEGESVLLMTLMDLGWIELKEGKLKWQGR